MKDEAEGFRTSSDLRTISWLSSACPLHHIQQALLPTNLVKTEKKHPSSILSVQVIPHPAVLLRGVPILVRPKSIRSAYRCIARSCCRSHIARPTIAH